MKKFLIILVSIIFLGFLLRTYNLTHFPIFGDEAIYIRWAQQMRDHPELRFVPLSDGKQPLFMWSIIPLLKIFDDPLVAGRAISAISGMGTMLGIFLLTFILFSKDIRRPDKELTSFKNVIQRSLNDNKSLSASLLAAFLYAVSPFSVFFDRIALVDSMLAMFGVWSLIFALLTVIYLRLDTAILTGFALGGALLTKSPAVFFAILLPAVAVFRLAKDKSVDFFDRNLIFTVPLFVFAYIISYGLYNILRLGPNFHMLESRTLDYVYPYNHIFTSPLDPFLPFLHRTYQYFLILGPGIVLLLSLFGIYKLFKENKAALLVLLIWFLIPIFIVAQYSQTMTARYVYFAVPYIFILASTIVYYKGYLSKVMYFGVFVIVLLAFRWHWYYHFDLFALNLPQSERSGYLQEWTSGIGISQIAEHIKNEKINNPEKEMLIGAEGYFGTLPQGLDIYLYKIPGVEVIGIGVGIEEIPEKLLLARESGKSIYLVVNNDRVGAEFDPESLSDDKLILINEYPKLERDDGSVQKLQFFKLE